MGEAKNKARMFVQTGKVFWVLTRATPNRNDADEGEYPSKKLYKMLITSQAHLW
jgi:hypothetical protein